MSLKIFVMSSEEVFEMFLDVLLELLLEGLLEVFLELIFKLLVLNYSVKFSLNAPKMV